jgi:hypothetical protein
MSDQIIEGNRRDRVGLRGYAPVYVWVDVDGRRVSRVDVDAGVQLRRDAEGHPVMCVDPYDGDGYDDRAEEAAAIADDSKTPWPDVSEWEIG